MQSNSTWDAHPFTDAYIGQGPGSGRHDGAIAIHMSEELWLEAVNGYWLLWGPRLHDRSASHLDLMVHFVFAAPAERPFGKTAREFHLRLRGQPRFRTRASCQADPLPHEYSQLLQEDLVGPSIYTQRLK